MSQSEPITASRWRIISLGEAFDTRWIVPVQNMEIGGKASLEDYADHLNRAAVGISLMVSPHPSYPPLEMAEAGVLAITNRYGCKDLSRRFPEIISIERVDPELLAEAIGAAVREAEERRIGKIVPRRPPSVCRQMQAGFIRRQSLPTSSAVTCAMPPAAADRFSEYLRRVADIGRMSTSPISAPRQSTDRA